VTAVIETVAARLTHYPTVQQDDGRRADVSDGVHTQAEKDAGAAIRVHRGVDITWHRKTTLARGSLIPDKPFGSRGYLAPRNRHDRPVVAAGAGRVVFTTHDWHDYGKLTGAAIYVDHGEVLIDGKPRRLLSAYHHLELACVGVGQDLEGGQLLGIMGASPPPGSSAELRKLVPFQPDALVHLHFDLFHRPPLKPRTVDTMFHPAGRPPAGVYLDGAAYIARLRQLRIADVWGAAVKVGPAEDELVG
jgi:hypothetical protein